MESLGLPTVLVKFGYKSKDGRGKRLAGSALVIQVRAKGNQAWWLNSGRVESHTGKRFTFI